MLSSKDRVDEAVDTLAEMLSRHGKIPYIHQLIMFEAIVKGYNTLLIAPTGSGKTEAAVLPVIYLIKELSLKPISALYITPLKALINDLNYRISVLAEREGVKVMRKHGDVPSKERRRRIKDAPHILITTPESLKIDLDITKSIRKYLTNIKWVIIDEAHELLGSKRGLQLALGLERLRKIAGDFQVIMLSATIEDPLKVVRYFCGSSQRLHKVIIASNIKKYHVDIVLTDDIATKLKEIIENERGKVLIFVNSRRLAERIHKLITSDTTDSSLISIHHSSISKSSRESTEERLRRGDVKVVVATKTLELGIDIGDIDLVVHIGPPSSPYSLIQRAGRSRHRVDEVSRAVILVDDPIEYLISNAIVRLIDQNNYNTNENDSDTTYCFLDVVTRELLGEILARGAVDLREFAEMVSNVYPCRNVTLDTIKEIAQVLSSSGLIRLIDGLKAKLGRNFYKLWSRDGVGRDLGRFFSFIQNDDKFFVRYGGKDIGTLDYAYVMKHLRPLDKLRIGGKVWEIIDIDLQQKVVSVKPSASEADIPFWRGSTIMYDDKVIYSAFKLLEICDYDDEILLRLCREYEKLDLMYLLLSNDRVFLKERYGDLTVIYGPQGHRFFELLGYVILYAALTAGLSNEVRVRVSPLGIAVTNMDTILRFFREINDETEAKQIIMDSIRFTPNYQIKIKELLPSFGSSRFSLVKDEAIRQVMAEYGVDENKLSILLDFILGRVKLLDVTHIIKGLSPIAKYVINSPPLRLWYGSSYYIITDALKGMALTLDELSEVTGLPKDYIARKIRSLRRVLSPLHVISFYDLFDNQVRFALSSELEKLASDVYADSFIPKYRKGKYCVTIYVDEYDAGSSFIVTPEERSIDRAVSNVNVELVYKVIVRQCDRERGGLVYYYVPRNLLKLIILNGITYIQGNGFAI